MGSLYTLCMHSNVNQKSNIITDNQVQRKRTREEEDIAIKETEASHRDSLPYETHRVEKSMKLHLNKLNEGEKNIPKESKEVKLIEEIPISKDTNEIEERRKSNDSIESEKHEEEEMKGSKIKKLSNLFVDVKKLTSDLLEEINFMRNNPKQYARTIENHIQYIVNKDNQIYYENMEYKVPLYKGEAAFHQCINILKNTIALKRFEYTDLIRVVCGDKLEDQDKVDDLVKEIKSKFPERKIEFNYEFVYAKPEIITVMLLVDDNPRQIHSKRSNLLNEDFRNLGISIKKAAKGKLFCLYLTYSD